MAGTRNFSHVVTKSVPRAFYQAHHRRQSEILWRVASVRDTGALQLGDTTVLATPPDCMPPECDQTFYSTACIRQP